MLKYFAAFAIVLAGSLSAGSASAQSSFTETCSNYGFVYSGDVPALHATCLTTAKKPNATTMVLTGIENVKGTLTNLHSSAPSDFQLSCGSINIISDGPYVTLSAYCAAGNNQFSETSLLLNNINNVNGNLVQGH
jgi:hypothetical protein